MHDAPATNTADDALDDQPAVAETLAGLRQRIESMLGRHERRLPSERQLAAELGVGRATVRRALAALQSDGTVVRHVGRGTFVASGAGAVPPQLQALALGGALAIDRSAGLSPRELFEVRHVLEPTIAELAALAARRTDVERMQDCLRRREQAWQIDDYEHWDYELHMSIVKATHNSVLIEMLDLVNRLRRSSLWRQFRGPSMKPAARDVSNAQHRAIVDAIARADPAGAFAAMRIHLGRASGKYDLLLQELAYDKPAAARGVAGR